VPWFLRSASRLFVTLLLIVGVPFAALSLDVVLSARALLRQQAIEGNAAAADLGADFVAAHFDGLVRFVESYAGRPDLHRALQAGDGVAVRAHLREMVDHNSSIDRAFIADLNGTELFDWKPDPRVIGLSFAYRDWYKGVSARKQSYVSEIYVRQADPQGQVVAIATPIAARLEGEVGTPLGYLVAQYPIESLTERLAEIRPPNVGAIHLFDRRGHVSVGRTGAQSEPRDLRGAMERMIELPGTSKFGPDFITGKPSLLCWSKVQSIDGLVVAQLPEEAVYAPARNLGQWFALAALLCLAGMLGLGFVWLNVVRRHHLALLDLQRQKDLLSGMLIHDLRNPLAATLGSIDLLRTHAGEMGPLAREDVTRADRSARRVRDLLNTLLDIMRMEEGVLAVHAALRDLGSFVRAKADEFRPLAEAGSLTLRETVPDAPLEVRIDPELLGRVLDNLITNAVKHTPAGGAIEIALAGDPGKGLAILTVSDTGEGIQPDAMPLLFQKFAPIEGQTLKRPHDTGLGLVFCRMAIELHGGTIEAHSQPGRGSTFRVALPLPAAKAASPTRTPKASGRVS
jgi:signal transduction histidine kinase